jgi:hypothetical protein
MRNFTKLVIASAMLATQATPTAPSVLAAPVQTKVPTVVSSQSHIVFSTELSSAVEVKPNPQPSFDSEVLAPLRAAQAEAARIAAAKAAAAKAAASKLAQASKPVSSTFRYVTGPLSEAQIQFLGNCESGMTATRNSGNGFYGAFQFTISTWNAMGTGYARADLAPLDVQIAAVQKLLSKSSIFNQFPGCARKMQAAGLL